MRRREMRPDAEGLEVRRCLAASASVVRGTLMIAGDSAGSNLRITQVDARTFEVQDGGTLVGRYSGVTRDVSVSLGEGTDTVAVDLGGRSTPRGLTIVARGGDDMIDVGNGRIVRNLTISAGVGADTVRIGGSAGAITVAGSTSVGGGDGRGDSLDVGEGATLQGNLSTSSVNAVTLGSGSVLLRGASLNGALNAANAFALNGRVDRDVFVYGGRDVDTLTVGGSSALARDLTARLGTGNDSATISASIGEDLTLDMGDADDSATLNGRVAGKTIVRLGAGNDALTLNGTIGGPSSGRDRSGIGGFLDRLFGRVGSRRSGIDAGSGTDLVTIAAASATNGPVDLRMGSGDDTLVVADATTLLDLRADGGTGTNIFTGRRDRLNLAPINFQVG
ncbi:hypothetical protein TA3x_004829 [Tundrisphaera sp. TA3]|uniref:hypothetical protein n=1 Tax=Tundrisphaera sp. TA3 TaxID=3435775 RepID=UPI003EBC276C